MKTILLILLFPIWISIVIAIISWILAVEMIEIILDRIDV